MSGENELTIALAMDVLEDHFGVVIGRVGRMMLERGPLTIQDMLRLGGAAAFATEEEALGFQEVRNALLILVQHNIIVAKPMRPDAPASVPQVYVANVDEALARIRFPHFLECVRANHGAEAQQLVFAVLKHGRASASRVIGEVSREREANGQAVVPEKKLKEILLKLVQEQLLSIVEPISGGDKALEAGAKRKAEALEADGGADGEVATAASHRQQRESVYRYSMHAFNLLLCKNLLGRLMEERVSTHAAQVLAALLAGVRIGDARGKGVEVVYFTFQQAEDSMKALGGHTVGGDTNKEREKLRTMLDFLSSSKEGVVTKKVETAANRPRRRPPTKLSEPAKAAKSRNKADAEENGESTLEQNASWAVEWANARKLLVNAVMSQLIRDQFGPKGLRMFNLLIERVVPQKLEDKEIFGTCMVAETEGREILNDMIRHYIVQWQEVPKSDKTPLAMSYWLYYVDHARLHPEMLLKCIQAVLNLRIRFRTESARVAPLESRLHSLAGKERSLLQQGRRIEDILERSFLTMDMAVLVLRCI